MSFLNQVSLRNSTRNAVNQILNQEKDSGRLGMIKESQESSEDREEPEEKLKYTDNPYLQDEDKSLFAKKKHSENYDSTTSNQPGDNKLDEDTDSSTTTATKYSSPV